MPLRQWLRAGHLWVKHLTLKPEKDTSLRDNWSGLLSALFTVDSSAELDAVVNCHGLKLGTGTHSAPTHSHHQESHNMWSSHEAQWNQKFPSLNLFPANGGSIQISLFILCYQPWNLTDAEIQCWQFSLQGHDPGAIQSVVPALSWLH